MASTLTPGDDVAFFHKHAGVTFVENSLEVSVSNDTFKTEACCRVFQWGVGVYRCDGAWGGHTSCPLGAPV